MTIGVRYWHTDTRIASKVCGLTGKWLGSINVRLLRPAPTDRHTHAHTQRHMCPQTSFKEACIHAGTMHDPDQSRCNRSVRRPRTRPSGDRHQMLDVGWSRAEEPITEAGDQRPVTQKGVQRWISSLGIIGGPSATTPEKPGMGGRDGKPFEVETYWSNERYFSEKYVF